MAGLGPAIHGFAASIRERRGWPASAGHDDEGRIVHVESQSLRRLVAAGNLAPAREIGGAGGNTRRCGHGFKRHHIGIEKSNAPEAAQPHDLNGKRALPGQSLESARTSLQAADETRAVRNSARISTRRTNGGPQRATEVGFHALRAKRNFYSSPWPSVALHSSSVLKTLRSRRRNSRRGPSRRVNQRFRSPAGPIQAIALRALPSPIDAAEDDHDGRGHDYAGTRGSLLNLSLSASAFRTPTAKQVSAIPTKSSL